jgi:hypothetical protein
MICGFGGGNATGFWPRSLQKNFPRLAQIPWRRGSLRAKFIENLRKQAQRVCLLPSGGTKVRSNKKAANERRGGRSATPTMPAPKPAGRMRLSMR